MNLEKLFATYPRLLQRMESEGYSAEYIKQIEWEMKWLQRTKGMYPFTSYTEMFLTRVENGRKAQSSKSREYHLRAIYTILQKFEEDDVFPDRRKGRPLLPRSSYYKLLPEFQEIMDLYQRYAESTGLKESTVKKRIYKGSSFLLYMQGQGHNSLSTILETDVLAFFTDSDGAAVLSSTYKREIAAIFRAELGVHSENAHRIVTYLPDIRKRRKNIQYLTPEESKSIQNCLNDRSNGLTARNRALGMLLYFTGLRAVDAATLRFEDIDWEKDEIHILQHKSGVPVNIPLSAVVGNTILDYIRNERPESDSEQIFLCGYPPYDPILGDTMWIISATIYKAAGVRQSKGERRGAHLFRYHLATHLMEQGISQPIISEVLGHDAPESLNYYLAADMVHLRECTLSIEEFPVSEEVFCI